MSETIIRNRRLRKKLYLEEFAILGFEFSFTLTSSSGADYEQFFTSFAAFVDKQHLYITLENDGKSFQGSATSADRYGNATEKDRADIEALLSSHAIVTDLKVGSLVDAFYEM
ncbi:MAG: YggL family protein [Paraglaciecola sp.]|uniref:YggL 50S ribosome-binding family protein n=1 Tax=Pseudomonadati TaxID=3379134 RepID=UPI002740168A|nr:50S ribosome-binding protein YggL [Paraglaciecola sp.]MDP5031213.1 YggL family protein [Paraglaciecola sp.]MDP5132683.1 YggL family protein [Paraglaciecola sp.]